MHDNGGFGDAEAGTAVPLRHRDAEPATFGHRLMKLAREALVLFAVRPIVVAKAPADCGNTVADRAPLFSKIEHDWIPVNVNDVTTP